MHLKENAKNHIQTALNESIISYQSISNNGVATCFKLTTMCGDYFYKHSTEEDIAASVHELILLSGYVSTPKLITHAIHYYITQWIPTVSTKAHGESIARELSILHTTTHTEFGFTHHNTLGSVTQYNTLHSSWAEFFWKERLEYQFTLAQHTYSLRTEEIIYLRSLQRIIKDMLDIPITPVLLHGDLWYGNILTSSTKNYFIDTACYYGHHEADLSLGYIFGGFSEAFCTEYFSRILKASGHEQRKYIYMLYHYLNHLNMFGSGYKESVLKCANRIQGV